MCILDLEESEVTNDGTQEFGEMIRTAVVRGLTARWDGSFPKVLGFHHWLPRFLQDRGYTRGMLGLIPNFIVILASPAALRKLENRPRMFPFLCA